MKFQEQKLGHFWWKQNARYTVYIVRELSGVMIAIFIIGAFIHSFVNMFGWIQTSVIPLWLSSIGMAGALIHTVTWLYVMPQLLPFKLTPFQQKIVYIIFLGIWLGLSYFLLRSVF